MTEKEFFGDCRIISISGSRDYEWLDEDSALFIDLCRRWGVEAVVHGGAVGVDLAIGKRACQELGLTQIELRPRYEKYPDRPKFAPIARNTTIVERGRKLVAFWNGRGDSRGTLDAIFKAEDAGKLHCVLGNGPCNTWKNREWSEHREAWERRGRGQ